jgi:hypothetical protein
MRLRLLLALALMAVLASEASAVPRGVPSGPGPRVRGMMYASVLEGAKVQILVRECADPKRQRRCMLVPAGIRREIEGATGGTVRWVYHAWPKGGTFYVLGPVYRLGDRAWFRFAWTDPAPGGCSGGGRQSFRRGPQGWAKSASTGYEGCPTLAA